jgi:hypothetical protein
MTRAGGLRKYAGVFERPRRGLAEDLHARVSGQRNVKPSIAIGIEQREPGALVVGVRQPGWVASGSRQ